MHQGAFIFRNCATSDLSQGETESRASSCRRKSRNFGKQKLFHYIFNLVLSVAGVAHFRSMMWCFILFIACAGMHVGASCPLVMSPPAVVVRFGDSFSVNCTSLSSQTDGMGWESSAGGTSLTAGVTSVPLNIKSLQEWTLEPTCYMNLKDGDQCSQILPVTVYKMPDSMSMSQPSPTHPMVEGQKYRMQCDIVNVAPAAKLSVYWHKGKKIIYTETFNETRPSPVNKSSILELTAHGDDNGIQIWCEAKLNFWPPVANLPSMTTTPQAVTVLYPPTFTKPANETVEVKSESELFLNCTARGNPAPVYSWRYPQPLQQTDKKNNENQPIFARSFHLPGTYNCTVSNSQGTKTKCFNVIYVPGNRTTLAAIVAVFALLGAVLLVAGLFFVTPNGSFSLNNGNYIRGQPTSSVPV